MQGSHNDPPKCLGATRTSPRNVLGLPYHPPKRCRDTSVPPPKMHSPTKPPPWSQHFCPPAVATSMEVQAMVAPRPWDRVKLLGALVLVASMGECKGEGSGPCHTRVEVLTRVFSPRRALQCPRWQVTRVWWAAWTASPTRSPGRWPSSTCTSSTAAASWWPGNGW